MNNNVIDVVMYTSVKVIHAICGDTAVCLIAQCHSTFLAVGMQDNRACKATECIALVTE